MAVVYLLLAIIASEPAASAERAEAIWVDVPHGSFPNITKFQIVGKLPKSGNEVGASFRVQEGVWQVIVEREGRNPVRLQVHYEQRGSPHFGRALLWASGDEQELRLKVPYGDPHDECFTNGKDVFASVYLFIPGQGAPEVHVSRFENCENETERLAVAEEKGWLVVAN